MRRNPSKILGIQQLQYKLFDIFLQKLNIVFKFMSGSLLTHNPISILIFEYL